MKMRSWIVLGLWVGVGGATATALLSTGSNDACSAASAGDTAKCAPCVVEEGELLGGGGPIGGSGFAQGLGSGPASAAPEPPVESMAEPATDAEEVQTIEVTFPPGMAAMKPPTASVTFDPTESEVDRILAQLSTAAIAFNTPEEIPYGDTVMIELLLSLPESEQQLASGIAAPGPVETARIKFSNSMEAKLTGLGFRIEPITPETQAVSRRERTHWQWAIEPLRTDVAPLQLTLSARVRVDGEITPRTIQTFERTIVVRVSMLRRATDFVSGNIEFLATGVLAPLAIALWRRWRRKETPEPEAEPARRAA